MNDNRFYVYALLDPRKPGKYEYGDICFLYEPFYIGKGKGRRCYDHLRKASNSNKNSYKLNKIRTITKNKMSVIILKTKINLAENKAFDIEKKLISLIGRIDLNEGTLTNLDEGGIGSSGNILKEKTKILIGKNNSKYWKNKKIPEKSIIKMKETKKKNPQDYKWKYRKYKVTDPDGKEFIISEGLKSFCDKNNLASGKMILVAQKKRNHHKKWKCEYIDKNYSLSKDKTYILTDNKQNKYIIDDIINFSNNHNLIPKRLYEVAKGKHCVHRGWKCEYYNPD